MIIIAKTGGAVQVTPPAKLPPLPTVPTTPIVLTPAAPPPKTTPATTSPLPPVTTAKNYVASVPLQPALTTPQLLALLQTATQNTNPLASLALIDLGNRGPGPTPPVPTPTPPKKKPPGAADIGPFAGVGMFTSDDPLVVLRSSQGGLDWVALQGRHATPLQAQLLKAAGLRVLVWEDGPSEGQALVDRIGAAGYIGQAEGQGQMDAALALGANMTAPKAMVTNLFMSSFPPDWVCLPEAYKNANPNADPRSVYGDAVARGAYAVAPVAGVYDAHSEGGQRLSLASYDPAFKALPGGNWSVFDAENMEGDDWHYLKFRSGAGTGPTVPPITGGPGGGPGGGNNGGGNDGGSTTPPIVLPPGLLDELGAVWLAELIGEGEDWATANGTALLYQQLGEGDYADVWGETADF